MVHIWAADGRTPLNVFSRAMEENAKYFPSGILWITQVSDRACAQTITAAMRSEHVDAVCLDKRDDWDWFREHEVTLRIARGILFGVQVKAWCICHDDMALPAASGFASYLEEWLASDSDVLTCQAIEFVNSFTTWNPLISTKDSWHAYVVKEKEVIDWKAGNGKYHGYFIPRDAKMWQCPWPCRHYKAVNLKAMREYNFRRNYRNPLSRIAYLTDDKIQNGLLEFDPEITWEDIRTNRFHRTS